MKGKAKRHGGPDLDRMSSVEVWVRICLYLLLLLGMSLSDRVRKTRT